MHISCFAALQFHAVYNSPLPCATMDEKNELESSKYEGVHEHIDEMLDDKKIKRKVDRWILPAMFMAYFLEFLDKVALNVR